MKLKIIVTLLLAAAGGMLAAFAATPPAPKSPAPVVDIRWSEKAHFCWLIGGSDKGKWLEAKQVARSLKGGESYRLYSLTESLGKATGTKPTQMGHDAGRLEGNYELEISPLPKKGTEGFAVGGDWNALPRVPKVLDGKKPEYQKIVRDFLVQQGLKDPKVDITRILQVDLEGDGKDELLISATNNRPERYLPWGESYPNPEIKLGDYSYVLLYRPAAEKSKTIEIAGGCSLKKDDLCTTIVVLPAVLDVDGDGRMEIFVRGEFWEGEWLTLFSVQGEKILPRLDVGGML